MTNVVLHGTTSAINSTTRDFASIEETLADAGLTFNQLQGVLLQDVQSIEVRFDQPINTPTASDLTVLQVDDVEQVGVDFVAATSVAAGPDGLSWIWTLDEDLEVGDYVVTLSDTVTAAATGAALDGEWINPRALSSVDSSISSFVDGSGDGAIGGDFLFAFNVLLGDVDFDNDVDGDDFIAVMTNFGSTGSTIYMVIGDGDGDADVDGDDLIAVQTNFGNTVRDLGLIFDEADTDGDGLVTSSDDPTGLDLNRDGIADAVDQAIFDLFKDLQISAT